ncbi:IS630 transposase-related protein [Pleurocapsa sp. CCALA 161]|uniref:IS630 transposase-related protein n=1 Tax=Pleurocapsa sp. CCALA 161 TaxID=2107688 RepID=UPI0018EBC090|nr:IS630 transposase-related protein [Pleurocapsa sp. CCALA 161]
MIGKNCQSPVRIERKLSIISDRALVMPAPYSYDLRKKAIEAVKRGDKKINVGRLFKISRNTLDLWLKREKETGDYVAIADRQGRHSKIKDEEKFKVFVQENKGASPQLLAVSY